MRVGVGWKSFVYDITTRIARPYSKCRYTRGRERLLSLPGMIGGSAAESTGENPLCHSAGHIGRGPDPGEELINGQVFTTRSGPTPALWDPNSIGDVLHLGDAVGIRVGGENGAPLGGDSTTSPRNQKMTLARITSSTSTSSWHDPHVLNPTVTISSPSTTTLTVESRPDWHGRFQPGVESHLQDLRTVGHLEGPQGAPARLERGHAGSRSFSSNNAR